MAVLLLIGVVNKGAGLSLLVDGEKGAFFDAVGLPVFSPDGKRLAYLARRGDREFVVADEQEGASFDVIWPDDDGEQSDYLPDAPVFSSDGASLAWRVRLGRKETVVVNEERGSLFDAVQGAPRFCPASGAIVFGVFNQQKEYVVVGQDRGQPFDQIWNPQTALQESLPHWTPIFSDDGQHVVFGARVEDQVYWKVR